MKYIKKAIASTPYYVPLSAHIIRSYTVNVHEDTITANIESYYDEAALKTADSQPLGQNSIVLVGEPVGDTLDWCYEQLVLTGEQHPHGHNFQGSFQMTDRNLFVGGEILTMG